MKTENHIILTSLSLFIIGCMVAGVSHFIGMENDKIITNQQTIIKQNNDIIDLTSLSICKQWEKDYSPSTQLGLNRLGLNQCTIDLENMIK